MTYSEVNSHGPLPPTTFPRHLRNEHKTAKGSKHCQRQSMIWRWNARRLPPMGATPSPYPLTRLPVGAYLLVQSYLEVKIKNEIYQKLHWSNSYRTVTTPTYNCDCYGEAIITVIFNACTHTFQRNTQNQYIFGVRNRFHDCLLKCPMKTWQDISSFSSFRKAPHIKFLALVTLHSHHDSHDTFEKRFKFLFIGYSGFKFCFGFYHGNIQEEPYCNNCWGMLLNAH